MGTCACCHGSCGLFAPFLLALFLLLLLLLIFLLPPLLLLVFFSLAFLLFLILLLTITCSSWAYGTIASSPGRAADNGTELYISVIPGVSRANGVSAAIGDSRGFLPIGGRDRTLADHNLSLNLLHGAYPELALSSYSHYF